MADSIACEQCGAEQAFDPALKSLKCPFCGHVTEIELLDQKIEELDFQAVLAEATKDTPSVEVTEDVCSECNASVTLDENVAVDECPYCGSTLISQTKTEKRIQPKSLLPFEVTADAARAAFRKWIKGLWFAPNKLKEFVRVMDKLQGIYVPFWTYDTQTHSQYTGQRGVDYYVTESYTATENGKSVSKTRQVRKTRWYSASGTVNNAFDDVLVEASQSLPVKYLRKLEPWDLDALVPYRESYLSGFRAESYSVPLDMGFEQAKALMEPTIESTIRADIGGDRQRIHYKSTQYNEISFKHILLPVWCSAFRYRDRVFRFMINARTGEVQGERPWSKWKIAFASIAAAIVIGSIVYFVKTH